MAYDGKRAFALSQAGLFWLSPGNAGPLQLPANIPVAMWNGVSMSPSSQLVVFGKGGLVALIDPDGEMAPALLPVHASDLSYLGATWRDDHLYLVGATESEGRGATGILSHYWERSLVRTHRTPNPCTLRGCASIGDGEVFACGEAGVLTVLLGEAFIPIESPCAARLSAMCAGREGVFAVGEGGHVIRLKGNHGVLEAAGTQQDLHCIEAGPDGNVWVGAGEGRILRYVPGQGFPRANRGVVHNGSVLHVWSRKDTVRALTSDGSILLGARS